MKILVVNCGSSSIKYKLIRMPKEELMVSGLLERIGESEGRLTQTIGEHQRTIDCRIEDHRAGMQFIVETLLADEHRPIRDISEIVGVGHRVVHGGEQFVQSVLIDDEVIAAIDAVKDLAPLHNPPNLTGIRAAKELLPNVPHVAVFDTSFHQTMPDYAYLYALPYNLYKDHQIRRYGFHGTSHRYVAGKTAKVMGRKLEEINIITCHLGNGCSMTAIRRGKSIDTSMGMTPLEGLVMGTRCGDIDPAITFFLSDVAGMDLAAIDRVYNKKSGLLGLSGTSNDMRDIVDQSRNGNDRCRLALEIFVYRVRKYIGSYMAALGRTDAVTFCGGIGENAVFVRKLICQELEPLGIRLDDVRNNDAAAHRGFISTEDSPVKLVVIRTNEEIMIARDTAAVAFGIKAE